MLEIRITKEREILGKFVVIDVFNEETCAMESSKGFACQSSSSFHIKKVAHVNNFASLSFQITNALHNEKPLAYRNSFHSSNDLELGKSDANKFSMNGARVSETTNTRVSYAMSLAVNSTETRQQIAVTSCWE